MEVGVGGAVGEGVGGAKNHSLGKYQEFVWF